MKIKGYSMPPSPQEIRIHERFASHHDLGVGRFRRICRCLFCCRLRCKPLRKEPRRCCFWTYASHNEFEDWWILISFELSSVSILNQKNYGWTTRSDRGLHIIFCQEIITCHLISGTIFWKGKKTHLSNLPDHWFLGAGTCGKKLQGSGDSKCPFHP